MNKDDLLWQGKYRIPSARKTDWDYTDAGTYFITWCVKDRLCSLGNIIDNTMQRSDIGQMVEEEWHKTVTIRPNLTLNAWVVMPNHVHGILTLHKDRPVETFQRNVSTANPSRLWAGSLGAIVGQIKSVATKRIWEAGHSDFQWQTRFWDRILRNEREYHAACKYIANNPKNWAQDKDKHEGLYM